MFGTLKVDGARKGTQLSFDFNMGHVSPNKDSFGGVYNNVNYEIECELCPEGRSKGSQSKAHYHLQPYHLRQ